MTMKNDKKPVKKWVSFHDQLAILKDRDLIIENEQNALRYLKTIGYYRLSGYLYSFRQIDPNDHQKKLDNFIKDSHFVDVKKLYMFDKKLRQLALDALERIEVALRVNIAYLLGEYSPTAYLESQYFNDSDAHEKWLKRYQDAIDREQNKNSFLSHHKINYRAIPIWVGCEIWDFGTMSTLFKLLRQKDQDKIAKFYQLKSGSHLQTHLHAFNFIRNVAAHHGRLWNRKIVFKANLKGLPDKQWKQLSIEKVFVYFCLMKRMLDVICPSSNWDKRFLTLLDEFPTVANNAICKEQMGFIEIREWELWQ